MGGCCVRLPPPPPEDTPSVPSLSSPTSTDSAKSASAPYKRTPRSPFVPSVEVLPPTVRRPDVFTPSPRHRFSIRSLGCMAAAVQSEGTSIVSDVVSEGETDPSPATSVAVRSVTAESRKSSASAATTARGRTCTRGSIRGSQQCGSDPDRDLAVGERVPSPLEVLPFGTLSTLHARSQQRLLRTLSVKV